MGAEQKCNFIKQISTQLSSLAPANSIWVIPSIYQARTGLLKASLQMSDQVEWYVLC